MTRTSSRIFATLALASLTAASMAQAEPLSFKRTVTEGATTKYKLQVALEIQGNAIEITANITEKIVKVEKDGSYSVESLESDMELKMGGQSFPTDEGDSKPRTTKYSAAGVPLEMLGSDDDTTPESARLEFLNIIDLPAEAKKLGDKWSSLIKPADKFKAETVKSDYEFVRTEKVGAWDTAVVVATTKEQAGDKPAESKKTMWLDTKDFSLVKIEAKLTNAPLPGMPDPVDMTISITRQP
ncbi:MAG: hypothetical protein JNJ45_09110 [Chthonomonas sp.]|nr:hypothetical protein [Chthonomonas sp.]